MPRLVIAIGGNSLIPDGDHQTVQDQYAAAAEGGVHPSPIRACEQ